MLTLGQWVDRRRVDHFSIPSVSLSRGIHIAHPRWRARNPNNRPDLKVFDPWVVAFHQANNRFDRISALGEIIELGSPVIHNHGNDQYGQAVTQLYNDALIELNNVCGANYQQAIEHYITGVARPARTVRMNVILIKTSNAPAPQNALGTINNHIQTANALACYQQAQLTLARVGNVAQIHQNAQGVSFLLTAQMGAPQNVQGTFQDSAGGGDRLIDYCNALPRTADVDVVYVPGFDQDDVQGRTFRATVGQSGHIPQRPIIAVSLVPGQGGGATHATTLAHEMGHALCTEPAHSASANELMTAGHNRNGNNDLTLGQMAWFCNNPYVQ
jgi:hypothetical protein